MRIDSRRVPPPSRRSPAVLAAAGILLLAGCGEKEEPATDGPVVPVTTTTQGGGQGTGQTTTTTGEDGNGQGKPISDEKAVQDTIEKFLTSPNANQVCGSLLTPQFLRKTYGNVAGCKAARKPATLAVSAQISGLQVTGTTATAKAMPNGGINNDDRLTFTLRRAGSSWQISNLRSNSPVGP